MSVAQLTPGLDQLGFIRIQRHSNAMQHFSSSSMLYEDISYLCRPGEVNFSLDEDAVDSGHSTSNLLGISDSFQQQQVQGSSANGLTISGVSPFSLEVSTEENISSQASRPGNSPLGDQVSSGIRHPALNQGVDFEVDDSTGSQLLQEMLQSQSGERTGKHTVHGVRSATANNASPITVPGTECQQERTAASQWEDSLHVFHEMLLQQQQQQQAAAQLQEHFFGTSPGNAGSNSSSEHNHHHGVSHSPHVGGPHGPRGAVTVPGSQSSGGAGNYLPGSKFPGESELLSLLQLPRCAASSLPNTTFPPRRPATGIPGYHIPGSGCGVDSIYETGPTSRHHLQNSLQQLQNQPHNSNLNASPAVPLAHLFQNLPQAGSTGSESLQLHSNKSSLLQNLGFGRPSMGTVIDLDHQEKETGMIGSLLQGREYVHQDAANTQAARVSGIAGSGFSFDSSLLKGNMAKGGEPRGINHFATERQRREFLNEKYQTLRSLVPNPSKADRASIVADAIEYVKELKRTLQELQLLVEEKRRGAGKRQKRSEDGNAVADGSETTSQPDHQPQMQMCTDPGSQLRSSWLQRTSQQGTHVDVRIVHDEVNIKLTQRKRRKCLLDVMMLLHELHLDLLHAGGASVGEHDIYMFNTKISEGSSSIYAGYIAAKVIEAVDRA